MNLVHALDLAREKGARIYGIVGRDGGHTAKVGDDVVIVPTVVWHYLVSHPALKKNATKW